MYDITKPTAPKMPDLGRGTECIKILLSQASKSMQEPFVPMFFPVLGAHISGAEFQYPDNFLSTPAMTGDAYEDMHNALVANNVFTGWQPLHRIQFAHSKGDMIVPYGNYLSFKDANPDGEDDWYHIDNTFSDKDHLSAGTAFIMKLGVEFIPYFEWIDGTTPTSIGLIDDEISNMEDVRGKSGWYTLQGIKLQGKPTHKGVYINNGVKIAIQ